MISIYIYNDVYVYIYISPLAKQAPGLHPAGGIEEGDAIDGEELSQQELQELTEDCDDVERLDGQYMHMDCEWIMYRW
jgi:hypothetical protein